MRVVGLDHLLALADRTAFEAKMVINESGAVFGPVSIQHRDLRAEGVKYADEYKGNALAAMLSPGKIDLRFHQAFTDADVVRIIRALSAESSLGFIREWRVTYQGRALNIAGT